MCPGRLVPSQFLYTVHPLFHGHEMAGVFISFLPGAIRSLKLCSANYSPATKAVTTILAHALISFRYLWLSATPRRASARVALHAGAVAHQREVSALAAHFALIAFGLGFGAAFGL